MGRGRISMELIEKEKSRRTTFQKRKNGLMKKVNEFSILCDVDVCVLLFAPNFEGEGYAEPETWPKDKKEVHRILQKYYNTTIDRRPKIYDVQEYFNERMKKVEFDISKVRKEILKNKYPTWDESFKSLGEDQLRIFASILDSKLDACNQKMNMLKGDVKGKTIVDQSNKVDKFMTPYLTSNPSNYFNHVPVPSPLHHFEQNMPQTQIFPPLMNISDKNSYAFWPIQLGQSSQPSSMVSSAQGSYQVESEEERYTQSYPNKQIDANWSGQVDANVTYDPKIGMNKIDGVENDENFPPYYYNGNTLTMQPYPSAMQTLPFQSLQNLSHGFHSLSNVAPGFQVNGFYDMDIFQAYMSNYMDGRK